jgi:RHS repeat-associated protein
VNGQRTDYIYDGPQAIGELTAGGSVGWLTSLGIDEVIARYSQAGGRYYLTDALNTVIARTRADRSIQNSYLYSPWGETTSIGPDESNPIQYTARENDGTGLYYYRARYYDPRAKRFLSEDPIGLEGGVNLYTYVGNDPVSLDDPYGLDPDTPKKPILFPPNLPTPPEKPKWLCPIPAPPPKQKCSVGPIEFDCLSFPDSLKGPKPEDSPLPPTSPNPPPELPPTPSWPKFWKSPTFKW